MRAKIVFHAFGGVLLATDLPQIIGETACVVLYQMPVVILAARCPASRILSNALSRVMASL